MFNLDDIINEKNKELNEKWHIPDHPYRILIIGASASGKTNALLNLISQEDHIDKIYLMKKRDNAGIKHLNVSNAFIECSNTMDDVYENIYDYNPIIRKILIVFDDMVADIMSNTISK